MKKQHFVWLVALVCVLAVAMHLYGVTKTYYVGGTRYWDEWMETKAVLFSETDGDVNDFSETTPIYGTLQSISINTAGTDTSFKVYIKDPNGITAWSKTDCTSASDPYRYALTEANTATTHFRGIPMAGNVTVELADGDDATMTKIWIWLYYQASPQCKP